MFNNTFKIGPLIFKFDEMRETLKLEQINNHFYIYGGTHVLIMFYISVGRVSSVLGVADADFTNLCRCRHLKHLKFFGKIFHFRSSTAAVLWWHLLLDVF